MKISVIIPTYKPQSYIWECLDSLVAQTFPKEDFEVILVLNGCKEPYEGEIMAYLEEHPELQVNFIQTDQGGVSNARNIALDVATGEYVTFIDDDDYVSPSYLEELYLKSSPDTIGLCYPYAFNDGKPEVQILTYGITIAYDERSSKGRQSYPRSRKFFSGPWMKLIPMSFIQGRRYDVRFKNGEDSLFMFLISDKFKYVDYTSKNAIYYRRYRDGSAVMTKLSKAHILKNAMKMIITYSSIFWGNPFLYSFTFYILRLLGIFSGVCELWKRNMR